MAWHAFVKRLLSLLHAAKLTTFAGTGVEVLLPKDQLLEATASIEQQIALRKAIILHMCLEHSNYCEQPVSMVTSEDQQSLKTYYVWPQAMGSPSLTQNQALPLFVDEDNALKDELIEAKRRIHALEGESLNLRQENARLKNTQDDLLCSIAKYTEAVKTYKCALELRASGYHLFTECFDGRVDAVSGTGIDVVYQDASGVRFVHGYDFAQMKGAKAPAVGDFVFTFASVYRRPADVPTISEILKTKTGIEQIELSGEELTTLAL
jgi:hypothetical protein